MDRFPSHPGPPLTPVSLGLHPFPGPRGTAPGGYVPSPTCLSSPSLTSSPLNLSPLTPSQSNLNTGDDFVCVECVRYVCTLSTHVELPTLTHAVLDSVVGYLCVYVRGRLSPTTVLSCFERNVWEEPPSSESEYCNTRL